MVYGVTKHGVVALSKSFTRHGAKGREGEGLSSMPSLVRTHIINSVRKGLLNTWTTRW
jgi:hypothetical protein